MINTYLLSNIAKFLDIEQGINSLGQLARRIHTGKFRDDGFEFCIEVLEEDDKLIISDIMWLPAFHIIMKDIDKSVILGSQAHGENLGGYINTEAYPCNDFIVDFPNKDR